MYDFNFNGRVPDGWVAVDPRLVNEDALAVLLRVKDIELPFTTNITIAQRVTQEPDPLWDYGLAYRRSLYSVTKNLELLREDIIAEDPFREYGQDLQFIATVKGQDIVIKQTQFLVELFSDQEGTYLFQILYSAPIDIYDSAKSEMQDFIGSISADLQEVSASAAATGSQATVSSGSPVNVAPSALRKGEAVGTPDKDQTIGGSNGHVRGK